MALDDYAGLIAQGQQLVPDVNKQLEQQAQASMLSAEAQNQRAEAVAVAQKLSRAQQFQKDITTFDGSPTAASHLIMKYPEFADHLKQGWDVQDSAKKQADLLSMGEIYSAASGNNWELAKKLAHQRADAEKAAGFSDPAYDETLRVMDSAADGDPTQRKVVLNMLGTSIAAVTGPEHFATVYGGLKGGYTLDAGATRYDSDGHVVAQSPYLKTADGGILERDGTGGGDPASPGAAPTTAPGFEGAVEHVLSNEGGYNPSDMNGAPVNFGINQKANPGVDVKNLTRDQAKQIYHDKYWVPSGAENLPANLQAPYFDVYIRNPAFAKKALADSGGDPAKFMADSSAYFQKLGQKPSGQPYAESWANRDAKNTAIATGGAPSAAAPATNGAPPGYHWLAPPKPKDAPSGYRYKGDGSLEAIPGGPADPDGVKNQGPLKPQALEAATVSYIKTGKMPAGIGGQALKNQILNYVPTIMDRHGLTPDDMPSIQQQFQADSKAFSQRVGQLSYMRQSVGKLNQHAQDLSALIKAVPAQGQFKPFNWITQGVEGQFSNSTVTQLQAGLPLFEAEVARVMTGNPNSGSGQLSDNARHEFAVLSSMAAPSAKIDAINRIMKMTEEAVKSTRDETVGLKQRIGGGIEVYAGKALANPAVPATASPAVDASRQPPPGATKTATGPNGQKAALVNGHWVVY